jgi:heat-inducible transcriptional repressor
LTLVSSHDILLPANTKTAAQKGGNMDLTDRQIQILKHIIEEFTETAEPVGSETLDKKYNLGVSPATIRNEMVHLTEKNFLKQPHTSAGRVPTPAAIKFYINQLMKEKELPVSEEVAMKERVWDHRFEAGKLLREATRCLSERTHALSVAATDDQRVYHAGYANILEMPEFFDIDVTRSVLSLLDETKTLLDIFSKAVGEEDVHILVGEELGNQYFEPVGMVFTNFQAGPHNGALGVIGPARLNYPHIVPMVRYFGGLINEIARDWQ